MVIATPRQADAFTLPELLIAGFISGLLVMGAGQIMLSQMRTDERMEAAERQKSEWSRTSAFIEAEAALSQQVITNASKVNIPSSCGFQTGQFRAALDLRRDLPLVIYGVKPSVSGSLPSHALWRCGPVITAEGRYDSSQPIQLAMMVDGLDGDAAGHGFIANSSDSKSFTFNLALKGLSTRAYSQDAGVHSRVNPLYPRPGEGSLCGGGMYNWAVGSTNGPDTLSVPIGALTSEDEVLMCGKGGGDTITGSNVNDILECGDGGINGMDACTLYGMAGSDRLLGSNQNDTLYGDHPDINTNETRNELIGRGGDDRLYGGSGQNLYLPGPGNDTVVGGSGLDVVFFKGERKDYTLSAGCSKSSCTVTDNAAASADGTRPEGTDTLSGVEILIFKDARIDLDP
jgi:type II secretory pathway pseudopilin PulG